MSHMLAGAVKHLGVGGGHMSLRKFGLRYDRECVHVDEPEFDISLKLTDDGTWAIQYVPGTNLELLEDSHFWHWSAYEV